MNFVKESSGYQFAVAEGARRVLLSAGIARFGEPDLSIREQLDAIEDPARLEHLGAIVYRVSSWEELLQSE